MCSCHSILECCVMFSGVKLSIRSFVLLSSIANSGADQAIPGNDQNASPTNQKTAGSKLDRTS